MANRLEKESSPYLLQHADNPVDWYPWGEAALRKARDENKPILLSIGYAACHWCHVMAHESFEDPKTAAVMNQYFVNVKVDREERPDLDQIYMSAVQSMTGSGGWPMTVFLTPAGEPFYGGTYFPPVPRYNMPSFDQVLHSVAQAWQEKRQQIVEQAGQMATHIQRDFVLQNQTHILDPLLLDRAVEQLALSFDAARGGFGGAPKFPPSMTLEFLLRIVWQNAEPETLSMVTTTLDNMHQGGIYDHLGGGFARYSTDARWLVPHFEKMLYDNALLARVYLHAYQLSGRETYREVVSETLDWVLTEMTGAEGGFYSSMDADSEGEEGKFYVWSKAEIADLLSDDAALFSDYYDVSSGGNWEGVNILNTLNSDLESVAARFGLSTEAAQRRLSAARQTLYAHRAKRIWPGTDDKVLTAWNGLMLAAFAEAGRVLQRPDYVEAAVRNASFLYETMRQPDGRLLRTWRAGSDAKYSAYLEDYAYLALGLLQLYQATFDARWYVWARELGDIVLAHFRDANGGFFDVADDHEQLLFRPKNLQDNATPSANAVAADLFVRLSLFSGDGHYADTAEEVVAALYPAMAQYPQAFGHWLGVAWLLLSEPREIAVAASVDQADALLAVINRQWLPDSVVAVGEAAPPPLLSDRTRINGMPAAYVCHNFVCQLPLTDPVALAAQLERSPTPTQPDTP